MDKFMSVQDKNLKFDCAQLGLYQVRQYEHDISYHADIVALGLVKRLTHVALHLSKYAYGISLSRSDKKFQKDYTDAFVMIVSGANLLDIDLSEVNEYEEFVEGGFLSNYLYFSAIFSKSCESYDHFEKYSFHKSWESSICSLFKLFEKYSIENDIDVIYCANKRLDQVESRIDSKNVVFKIKNRLRV